MGLLVFKTSVPVTSWRVGSIPMHFRHFFDIKGLEHSDIEYQAAHQDPSTSVFDQIVLGLCLSGLK